MTETRCQCCGQALPDPRDPLRVLNSIHFSVMERMIVDRLLRSLPRYVSAAELIDASYGHRPDGGPRTATKAIHVRLFSIRRKLRMSPLAVERSEGYGGGWHLAWRQPLRAAA